MVLKYLVHIGHFQQNDHILRVCIIIFLSILGLCKTFQLPGLNTSMQDSRIFEWELRFPLKCILAYDEHSSFSKTLIKLFKYSSRIRRSHTSNLKIVPRRWKLNNFTWYDYCPSRKSKYTYNNWRPSIPFGWILDTTYDDITNKLGRITIRNVYPHEYNRTYLLKMISSIYKDKFLYKYYNLTYGVNITVIQFQMPYSGPRCRRHYFHILKKRKINALEEGVFCIATALPLHCYHSHVVCMVINT